MFDKDLYKNKALNILSPIIQANDKTIASKNFLFTGHRSDAGRLLPEYYLIYFLLADLLEFKNLGQFEKIAWSFPIDYNGRAFLIDYRKFGVGVFIQDKKKDEEIAKDIVKKINAAIKSIRPFYDFIAEEAVNKSQFNITNNNTTLYERFKFLLKLYKNELKKYVKHKGKVKTKSGKTSYGEYWYSVSLDYPYYEKANWLAISCIEAFFSWTEHLFIHLAVVQGHICDGKQVSNLIEDEWKTKFTTAITDKNSETIRFYNELLIIRQQLRNFVAHGAFGKNGNAFSFHSKTGAVPVLMRHKKQRNKFSLQGELSFKESEVIKLIEEFIKFLNNGPLAPVMHYTQDQGLPTILPYAANGTYKRAIKDMKTIKAFSRNLIMKIDNASNMDW